MNRNTHSNTFFGRLTASVEGSESLMPACCTTRVRCDESPFRAPIRHVTLKQQCIRYPIKFRYSGKYVGVEACAAAEQDQHDLVSVQGNITMNTAKQGLQHSERLT